MFDCKHGAEGIRWTRIVVCSPRGFSSRGMEAKKSADLGCRAGANALEPVRDKSSLGPYCRVRLAPAAGTSMFFLMLLRVQKRAVLHHHEQFPCHGLGHDSHHYTGLLLAAP
mmetsp:Transcript_28861/g.52738  ORF Transcript_28861/g.52738 Transcript_28861/m.52738 type:complete len:112 (+) Transcript_28861:396-731(+)